MNFIAVLAAEFTAVSDDKNLKNSELAPTKWKE